MICNVNIVIIVSFIDRQQSLLDYCNGFWGRPPCTAADTTKTSWGTSVSVETAPVELLFAALVAEEWLGSTTRATIIVNDFIVIIDHGQRQFVYHR